MPRPQIDYDRVRVAVVGCGAAGTRRAEQAALNSLSRILLAIDTSHEPARHVAERFGTAWTTNWRTALEDEAVEVVIVCTPQEARCEIAAAALRSGKHVWIEPPMGRDLSEAEVIAAAAAASTGLTKIGCGLRYHPAIARAREIVAEGGIGEPLAVRVRHDDAEAAIDLIHWFAGVPQQAFGYANEQHAFALLRYGGECTASLHASRTPWSSAFSFEAIGPRGSVAIEGVGGADGVVTLRALGRDESFRGPDVSAALEWDEFVRAIHDGRPYMGTAEDGLIAARIVHAIYASVRDNVPSPIRL